MIQINQLKIKVGKVSEGEAELVHLKKLALGKLEDGIRKRKRKLQVSQKDIKKIEITKKSIDARKKEQVSYSYSVRVEVPKDMEKKICNMNLPDITQASERKYYFQPCGETRLSHPPVIAGMGPAGLFLGLMLSEAGFCPVILEQGGDVEERLLSVENFWKTGNLDIHSNVQFGEGGAGTFSDGKLNTMVKDTVGRNRLVLELFVKYGAPPDILYKNKPHIGTDKLRDIVKNMRRRMQELGACIYFHTKLTNIESNDGRVAAVEAEALETSGKIRIPCEVLVLAIGHSARDTFGMLKEKQLWMQPKPFAIGVRVEHPQELINRVQYGSAAKYLPAADYKLTHQARNGRSIYSFCMCPGGYVLNASSEQGMTAVNGMSNYARDGRNANSALIVTVSPNDFGSTDVLSGVEFQRKWERAAFLAGNGKIPVQLYGDLLDGKVSTGFGAILPDMMGNYQFADMRQCLPAEVTASLLEGMEAFDKKIPGFGNREAVFSGVETRTSSPVRILRNEQYQANIRGIYPCGEGAGYAGGITSAAMDGIRVYEAVASEFQPVPW